MITIDNLIIADEGYLLRRKSNHQVIGKEYLCGYIYYNEKGERLDPPYLESEDDFVEVSESDVYGEIVTRLIRENYTISDELAIQRQRDEKTEAFQIYYEYCEECKRRARKLMEEGIYE